MRDIKQHITEDEFIGFYLEDLPEEEAKAVDQHIESCVACAKELEALYNAMEDFPTKRWEKDREPFIANLRQKIFPHWVLTYKEKLEVLLEKIAQEITNMLTPSLAFKTQEPIDIETDDGIFGGFIEEESNGDINVYLDSTILKFEGKRIRFYAGKWKKDIYLTKVNDTQLGAKFTINRAERNDFPKGTLLRAKLCDSKSPSELNAIKETENFTNHPDILDRIAEMLGDKDESDQRKAIQEVAVLSSTAARPDILYRLTDLLRDENKDIRKAAADAIKAIGSAAAKPELLDRLAVLLQHKDSDVRIAAARALGGIGSAAARPDILDKLAILLQDKDSDVRRVAAKLLKAFGNAEV